MLRGAGLVVAVLCGLVSVAHATSVELLVADHNAASDSSGAIIRVAPSGAQSVVSTNALSVAAGGPALFGEPYDVEVAPSGDIYVVDNQGAGGTPRLLKIDSATGRETVISTNAISLAAGGEQDFDSPTNIDITSAGVIYVTDPDLNITDQSGGIIQIDPATGRQTVVASNAISSGQGGEQPFASPFGIARGPDGTLYVGDYGGKVIRVDATGKATTIASGSPIVTPSDIEYGPDGMLYFADQTAGGMDNPGAIFSVSPSGGPVTTVSTNAISAAAGGVQAFHDPIGLSVRPAAAGGPGGGGGGGGNTGPPSGANGPDRTPPNLGSLSFSSSVFRAAKSGASTAAKKKAKAKIGTRVSFSLSEPSSVKFTVERPVAGRRSGKNCVAKKRSNAKRKACTRWVAVRGSFAVAGRAGKNTFTFRGRIGGRSLRPGRYRLDGKATDAAKNASLPRRKGFKIVR